MHSFGGKRLQQASTDCLPTALLATSVLLNFRHCHGQLSSLGPPSLENQHLVETTTRGVRVFLPRRANQIARPLSGVWPWTPRCTLPRRLCRVSQQQSYRYGVLAVNFLISAIIFWKNTQLVYQGKFLPWQAMQCMLAPSTGRNFCLQARLAPVIFLHSSMASTFMITLRTNAAFDCGSFLFVLACLSSPLQWCTTTEPCVCSQLYTSK